MRASRATLLNPLALAALVALLALVSSGCSDDDTTKADAKVGLADGGGGDAAAGDGGGADAASVSNIVETKSGPVKGLVEKNSRSFLGIPFAAPPVGPLRWKAPQPVTPWKDARDATKHGPSCPQKHNAMLGPPDNYDEDCLSLSVWTPASIAKKLPVFVWIHGGGFTFGGSATPLYDGRRLAAMGKAIVVAMNYRLGALGAFAHPAMGKVDGNFMLLDQRAALKWVKDNIAAFGGDPDNVTLVGESAGAMSVCTHMVLPESKGLFKRAVMQSGTCTFALTRAQAEAQGDQIAKKLGCDTTKDPVACLRGKTPTEVNEALAMPAGGFFGTGASWLPFLDGTTLTEQPMASVKANKAMAIPVIIGSNKNEGTLFLYAAKLDKIDEAAYKTHVAAMAPVLGHTDTDVLAKYPAASYSTPADALAELLGDWAFVCPARRLARKLSEQGAPTYVYHFQQVPLAYAALPFLRATHAAEIPFLFGNYAFGMKFPAAEMPLHEAIAGYWLRFVETGDPNGGSAVAWPAYKKASDEHLQLDAKIEKKSGLKSALCDFWDSASNI